MVGLIGVQSNQFPRALDLRPANSRPNGLNVVMGSRLVPIHVPSCRPISGSARSPAFILWESRRPNGREARRCGGKAKLDLQFFERHARNGLPRSTRSCRVRVVTRVAGHYSSFDPTAVARSSAASAPSSCAGPQIALIARRDDIEAIVRPNEAQGITRFFITDDISPATATGSRSSTG